MQHDWHELTKLTSGGALLVERVRLRESDLVVEGRFELPALAQLTSDDQVFVAAFVRCHGSIKEMEKSFGVSYPTIKNRLNRIAGMLPLVEVDSPRSSAGEVLDQLERGHLTVAEALGRLKERTS